MELFVTNTFFIRFKPESQRMSGTKDYYAVLGLRQDATSEDIKKAFKKLALKVHPDKNKNKAKAEEQFKKIGEAYKILSNPQTKLMFDRELAAADMKAKVGRAASAKAKAKKAASDRQERAAPAYAKARDENETRTSENSQNTVGHIQISDELFLIFVCLLLYGIYSVWSYLCFFMLYLCFFLLILCLICLQLFFILAVVFMILKCAIGLYS